MLNYFYILKNNEPVMVESIIEWATWFENAQRHVDCEQIGDSKISTVFISIDADFILLKKKGKPLLFETLVFGGPLDGHKEKCATWDQAVDQHKRIVELVKSEIENAQT